MVTDLAPHLALRTHGVLDCVEQSTQGVPSCRMLPNTGWQTSDIIDTSKIATERVHVKQVSIYNELVWIHATAVANTCESLGSGSSGVAASECLASPRLKGLDSTVFKSFLLYSLSDTARHSGSPACTKASGS